MQQYDYSKLLGRMRERGYTQEKLAKNLGISACSLNLSINNKRNFRQDEMLMMGKLLGVPASKLQEYFFAHKL